MHPYQDLAILSIDQNHNAPLYHSVEELSQTSHHCLLALYLQYRKHEHLML